MEPSYKPKGIDTYTMKQLQLLAKQNKVSLKGIKAKQNIYDVLVTKELV